MSSKIILGTVQFGLNYGINNSEGKPSENKVFDLLDAAADLKIDTLDTADGYGESQEIIGRYLVARGKKFKILSKFTLSESSDSVEGQYRKTLQTLNLSRIEGYSFHRPQDFLKTIETENWSEIKAKYGMKLGVSLYSLEDLQHVLKAPHIDIVQLPFNLFDSTLEKQAILSELRAQGKVIHIRSAFLQGLFHMDALRLPSHLLSFAGPLLKIKSIAQEAQLTIEELALGYLNSFDFIDQIVLGVDNIQQLQSNIRSSGTILSLETLSKIKAIQILEPKLLNPANWKPNE